MIDSYVLATISLDNMAGGLERSIVRLANRLADQGHRVSLITFDWESARSFYRLEDGIRWYKVATSEPHARIGFLDRLRLIHKIRSALKETEASALICFHHGILARFFLASLFLNIRLIVSERNSLRIYDHVSQSKWNLNFLLMFLADNITVQFPQYVSDYPHILQSRIVVIPNAVQPPERRANPGKDNKPHVLLAVGRLCAQKNYEALIDAFAALAPRFTDWRLVIVGDGDSHKRLHSRVERHGLDDRILLLPATASIFEAYENASLYCMPSKWEGFPNALAEAMAHGLPAIGYKGCAGVREFIMHGKNGLLAAGNGNVESLRASLECLMSAPQRRKEMGKEAAEFVKRFRPEAVYPSWDDLLDNQRRP